jgi:hypothetical protein
MRIQLSDGRVLEGTPEQIVRSMQSLSFIQRDGTLRAYVEWSVRNAKQMNELDLVVVGDTDEQLAQSFVDEMCRAGLASRE